MADIQRTLHVYIGDAGDVGILRFEAQGSRQFSTFEYSDAWLQNPRRFPLSPSMPLETAKYFNRADDDKASPLPMPFADTTPDSWGRSIIRKDTRESGARGAPLTEIDFLTAVDDFSRMGALRFKDKPEDTAYLATTPAGRHEIPPLLELDDLGRSIAELERREPMTAAALKRLRQLGSALGGARPKCSVLDVDGSLLVAKFTSRNDEEPVEIAEVLTLQLAALCGLTAAVARLDVSDSLPVALIKRFDRRGSGRIPYISAQTMLEAPDATSGTYTQMVDVMRAHSSDPARDISELFCRVGFTILVSNVDDHLKNHGFLYDGSAKWRLSPMFDVNPAPERHRELKTPISEISGNAASIEILIEHAKFFDLTPEEGSEKIRSMAEVITSNWVSLARELGMRKEDIAIYKGAFEHDDMQLALALGDPTISMAGLDEASPLNDGEETVETVSPGPEL
jgi:serine/threonine-protein kinase HipA